MEASSRDGVNGNAGYIASRACFCVPKPCLPLGNYHSVPEAKSRDGFNGIWWLDSRARFCLFKGCLPLGNHRWRILEWDICDAWLRKIAK